VDPTDLALRHDPTVAYPLIMVTVIGFATALINLRNLDRWLIRLIGRRATGVVSDIEIVHPPTGEVLRRPVIAYTGLDGRPATGSPSVFRTRLTLEKGSPVRVSYLRRRPARLVVHGYDFRLREPVYAALGLALALYVGVAYFKL
jgi:hypothetical protein